MMKTGKSYFLLPFLLLFTLSATSLASEAGRMMWVLGSFRDEARAETQAKVLSRLTGQEILIQSLLVNSSIRHRLLIQPEAGVIAQEQLQALLSSVNFVDHWRVWLMGDEMGVQSIISASASWQEEQDDRFDTRVDPVSRDSQAEAEIQGNRAPYRLPEKRSERVAPLSAADAASKIKYNPASLIRQGD
jgi:hypothetical protein